MNQFAPAPVPAESCAAAESRPRWLRWVGAAVPLATLCLLVGCGSTDAAAPSVSGSAAPVAAAAASASGTSAAGSSPAPGGAVLPTGNASSGIGDWPSFLPTPSDGGVPTGSVASPAMSYPGNAVVLRLGSASVRAVVDGPSYPTSTPVGAESVSCTFTLVLSEASAPVDLRTASFNVLDSQGGIHQMRTSALSTLQPGHRETVTIKGVLPSGEGLLRFYPTTAGAVAAWDYIAETD